MGNWQKMDMSSQIHIQNFQKSHKSELAVKMELINEMKIFCQNVGLAAHTGPTPRLVRQSFIVQY